MAKVIKVWGALRANGAGHAELEGGYGAGGGILLKADDTLFVGATASVTSLGGAAGNSVGTTINGGTIKLRAPNIAVEAIKETFAAVGILSMVKK